MFLIVFLLFLLVIRTQNGEIRTEDFMNFSNPIDSRENTESNDRNFSIEQYLYFNEESMLESDNHSGIETQQQNNISSDLFSEIFGDSSFMNDENTPSQSLFDPTSGQQLFCDKIKSFFDSISYKVPTPTVGEPVSFIEPGCQCEGLCLCITTPKPEKKPLDIESSSLTEQNMLCSKILFLNEQNQSNSNTIKTTLHSKQCQINCEVETNLNLTEQSAEQQRHTGIIINVLSPEQSNNISNPSHTRQIINFPEQKEQLYHDSENDMNFNSYVNNFRATCKEIQTTFQPSTSQEVVIPREKAVKKRKKSEESNEIAKRQIINVDSAVKYYFHNFISERIHAYSTVSENIITVNQAKILYDPESQDSKRELDVHLKICDYSAKPLLKRTMIQICFEHSFMKYFNHVPINPQDSIPKIVKNNNILYLFGTFLTSQSRGGSTFTVRVPNLFEGKVQFENRIGPLPSAFVPTTIADGYKLTLTMARIRMDNLLPSASFETDGGTTYFPREFYAYHFQQVIKFKLQRQMNKNMFYYFEYVPEKEVPDINKKN
ncbi:hypothetical protein M153_291000606 [Pseudoloma neurophilia]|uniref:Uncharacterized protein n=1 Tax=Pseudoloma neurophilia TaxID=146866 RepID=A0A0R0M2J2_9MICR|nr:hypothetical protein M153_291000606 [Pseudoloma neurophilia]